MSTPPRSGQRGPGPPAPTGMEQGTIAQLAPAAARAANVHVEWVRANATRFKLPGLYDAAVCLCEGAFGLLGQSDDPIEQPLAILCNVSRSLKPRGKAVFTVLNGAAMLRRYQDKDVAEGRFDPLTLVESSEHPPREGLPAVAVRERGFVPTELILLFRGAGMSVLSLWGGSRWELGKKAPRPGRDRDHDRGAQECRTGGWRRGARARPRVSGGVGGGRRAASKAGNSEKPAW